MDDVIKIGDLYFKKGYHWYVLLALAVLFIFVVIAKKKVEVIP